MNTRAEWLRQREEREAYGLIAPRLPSSREKPTGALIRNPSPNWLHENKPWRDAHPEWVRLNWNSKPAWAPDTYPEETHHV